MTAACFLEFGPRESTAGHLVRRGDRDARKLSFFNCRKPPSVLGLDHASAASHATLVLRILRLRWCDELVSTSRITPIYTPLSKISVRIPLLVHIICSVS